MKYKVSLMLLVAGGLVACNQESTKEVKLDTDVQKLSYAMGVDVGQSLKNLDADVDADAFSLAVNDVLNGTEARIPEEATAKIKQDFFRKKQEAQVAAQKNAAALNTEKGKAYLVENAKKAGVKVTASGLQYEVISEGKGVKPKPENTVKVNYRGTTIDGVEFDSSYTRGQPVTFPLNAVIKGWTEGVALMNVGSKYKFTIPSELAYGEHGAGAKIGPNSTLIFEVELLAIEK